MNAKFGKVLKEEEDEWVKRAEIASKEKNGTEELQRDFNADEIEKCITKPQSHKAAGEDGVVNEFMTSGGKEDGKNCDTAV